MSLQQIYDDAQRGVWRHELSTVCGCRGTGWYLSDVDTFHRCSKHAMPGDDTSPEDDREESAEVTEQRAAAYSAWKLVLQARDEAIEARDAAEYEAEKRERREREEARDEAHAAEADRWVARQECAAEAAYHYEDRSDCRDW